MSSKPSDRPSREQSISRFSAIACGALALAIPLCVAALWAFASWDVLALVRLVPPDIVDDLPDHVAAWQRVVGALICLVPALLLSYGLLRVRRSLAAFARADFFAADVVGGLRGYAVATFWAALAGLVSVPVLSLALTFARPHGHRELSLDFSGAQILNLLAAAILWVIASAMARASHIARENEQFV